MFSITRATKRCMAGGMRPAGSHFATSSLQYMLAFKHAILPAKYVLKAYKFLPTKTNQKIFKERVRIYIIIKDLYINY